MEDRQKHIFEIEKEIRETPYHKGTEHHIGKLRARIAKLKEEIIFGKSKRSGKGGGGEGFNVKKTGEATIVLVGPPSVGKSSLLNQLTNAESKVADYAFTTTTVIPGMMDYNGAKIQILDIPGLITGAGLGKGRGREIISVVRSADLVIIMVDIFTTKKIDQIKVDLHQTGIRLDSVPPKITIKKTHRGGIIIYSSVEQTNLTEETITAVLNEFRIRNAEIFLKENITLDRLVDFLIGNRRYIPYIIVVNKVDLNPYFYLSDSSDFILVSAQKNQSLDELRSKIWEKLNFIRIYLKERDAEADFDQPFILLKNESLRNLLAKISICTKNSFRKAKIYGPGAKFEGQNVSLSFIPLEGTIVSFS